MKKLKVKISYETFYARFMCIPADSCLGAIIKILITPRLNLIRGANIKICDFRPFYSRHPVVHTYARLVVSTYILSSDA